jgi:antitoxin VapB
MMTKVFQSGNSQAVRIPKEFRFETEEVEILRQGGDVILREVPRGLERAYELIASLPDDFLEELDDPPPQERKGL